ncbi:MAG: glycosyltransferase family 2 protein [Bacteroidota bacterium]
MKISLITVAYQAAHVLPTCIESVLSQDYPDLEYILIDGGSTDGTKELVESYGDRIQVFVSEPDKGIYDAMNKGINLATGEVVGLLNADDLYAHESAVSQVMAAFQAHDVDSVYGDLVYIKDEDLSTVVRYFPGKDFQPAKLKKGMMPPHPTFFVKRKWYDKAGVFDTDFKICADFDFMVRLFHTHGISSHYLPETLVKMRTGGASTQGLSSTLTINQEMLASCKKHGISTNLATIYSKYFTKIFQLVKKPG